MIGTFLLRARSDTNDKISEYLPSIFIIISYKLKYRT